MLIGIDTKGLKIELHKIAHFIDIGIELNIAEGLSVKVFVFAWNAGIRELISTAEVATVMVFI